MTLIYMDGFDHYTTLTDKGWVVSVYGGVTTGRNGNGGYTGSSWSAGQNGYVTHAFTANTEIVMGVALNYDDLSMNAYWQLKEGGTVHLDVTRNGSGYLEFRRGSGGTLLGTSTYVVNASTWFYCEVRIKVHDSTGTLTVKINDVQQFTFSGDTRNGGTSGALDTLLFGSGQVAFVIGQHNWYFDDLYICDVAGSTNNDFLGDVKVETKFPSGNGNTSALVGSDADSTNNYLLVDETPPNGDTDYVQSANVGDKDTYAMQDLVTATGVVYGVQVNAYAKKTDTGTRTLSSVARLSGTEVDSSGQALSGTYGYLRDIRETKPGGGSWSIADVNNAEFGVKVAS